MLLPVLFYDLQMSCLVDLIFFFITDSLPVRIIVFAYNKQAEQAEGKYAPEKSP